MRVISESEQTESFILAPTIAGRHLLWIRSANWTRWSSPVVPNSCKHHQRTKIRNGYPSSAPHAAEHGDSIPDPEVRRTRNRAPSLSRHSYIHMTLLLDSKFADCCTLVDYSQKDFSRVVDDIKWLFGSGELISSDHTHSQELQPYPGRHHGLWYPSRLCCCLVGVSSLQRSSIYLGTGGSGSQPDKLQPLFGFRGINLLSISTHGRNPANCGRLLWLWGSRLLPAKLRPV
ncbi:hypothetical protein B0H13DRAFT_1867052 [Mycena leptocephala]|nr:hypothetical protein B0H13DRAFT_1867052 [Mycena leptocephala]